jgi:hypothetical protein
MQVPNPLKDGPARRMAYLLLAAGLWLGCSAAAPVAAPPATPPVKIAVFLFELDDGSPSAASGGARLPDQQVLAAVTRTAQQLLQDSGRYAPIVSDASAASVNANSFRQCDGCEASIAAALGADQSLVGVVTRDQPIAYAMDLRIRDVHTGKLLVERRGVFLGASSDWAAGVTTLIKKLLNEA